MISGLSREISFIAITWNPESNCTVERRIISYSTEVHRKHIRHWTYCWKNIHDHWNVDGERELSDAWTGFTRFIFSNERLLDGYTWSGERQTRKQTNSRPDNVWPDMWKLMSDASKRVKRSKSGLSRNLISIMPETNVVSSSLNQMMKNLNNPWKTLVQSWKLLCHQQCLVKHQ